MKKLIAATVIILSISFTANAQTPSKPEKKENQKMEMKNGVMMVDSKPMLCSHYKCTPLTKEYTCSDGCRVSTDGTITKPDGSTMKLMNGYEISKEGKVTMIPHGQKGHVCGKDCPKYGQM
jgi:hypothetical protein